MKKPLRVYAATAALLLSVASTSTWAGPSLAQQSPEQSVYRLNAQWLAVTKAQIAAGDEVRQHALDQLLVRAEKALQSRNYSVVENSVMPPSGDKRDYVSIGPYWWPDPASDDGLPWIRRDGQVNPATRGDESDSHVMGQMARAALSLALAYHFTGDDRYVERSAELLQVFFLDPETAMNPNLNFGQGIPGRTDGRGIGIIETRDLMDVADAVGLLQTSPAFPSSTLSGVKNWYREFVNWLQTSEHGRNEQAQHNNHGTFYDAQVAHFALFIDNEALARQTLLKVGEKRLDLQIGAQGEQAHELGRTRPYHYSSFNLKAFFTLAQLDTTGLGTSAEADLWHYQGPQGSSLRRALDYLNTYQEHPVTGGDLVETQPNHGKLQSLNQMAGLIYGAAYADRSLDILRQGQGNLQCLLLFPVPTPGQLAPLARTLEQQSTQHEASSLCSF